MLTFRQNQSVSVLTLCMIQRKKMLRKQQPNPFIILATSLMKVLAVMLTFLQLMIHTSITLSLYQPEYISINNSVDLSYLLSAHVSRDFIFNDYFGAIIKMFFWFQFKPAEARKALEQSCYQKLIHTNKYTKPIINILSIKLFSHPACTRRKYKSLLWFKLIWTKTQFSYNVSCISFYPQTVNPISCKD